MFSSLFTDVSVMIEMNKAIQYLLLAGILSRKEVQFLIKIIRKKFSLNIWHSN
jgi:hypothetical protein